MKSTLMIKDLSLDKQLDSKAMSAVRGGSNIINNSGNDNYAFGGYGIGNVAFVNAPVTQTNVDIPTNVNIAGLQKVFSL